MKNCVWNFWRLEICCIKWIEGNVGFLYMRRCCIYYIVYNMVWYVVMLICLIYFWFFVDDGDVCWRIGGDFWMWGLRYEMFIFGWDDILYCLGYFYCISFDRCWFECFVICCVCCLFVYMMGVFCMLLLLCCLFVIYGWVFFF